MGSIRSSKVMATGLIILVLLNFAATTFAQSFANSTEIETEKGSCANNVNDVVCALAGLVCGQSCYRSGCCCRLKNGATCDLIECINKGLNC